MLVTVLIVLHVLVALAIIGLVLLQHGKGADMGSGFGGGASGSLFGATGSANFLSRATAVLATIFFILSLALAYLGTATTKQEEAQKTLLDEAAAPPAKSAPKGGTSAPPASSTAPAPAAPAQQAPAPAPSPAPGAPPK